MDTKVHFQSFILLIFIIAGTAGDENSNEFVDIYAVEGAKVMIECSVKFESDCEVSIAIYTSEGQKVRKDFKNTSLALGVYEIDKFDSSKDKYLKCEVNLSNNLKFDSESNPKLKVVVKSQVSSLSNELEKNPHRWQNGSNNYSLYNSHQDGKNYLIQSVEFQLRKDGDNSLELQISDKSFVAMSSEFWAETENVTISLKILTIGNVLADATWAFHKCKDVESWTGCRNFIEIYLLTNYNQARLKNRIEEGEKKLLKGSKLTNEIILYEINLKPETAGFVVFEVNGQNNLVKKSEIKIGINEFRYEMTQNLIWNEFTNSYDALIGSDIEYTCEAPIYDRNRVVFWKKDGEDIDEKLKQNFNLQITKIQPKYSVKEVLRISNVSSNGIGNYSCEVEKHSSSDRSSSDSSGGYIQLFLKIFTIRPGIPPSVNISENTNRQFFCEIRSFPLSKIDVYKNGENIDLSKIQVNNSFDDANHFYTTKIVVRKLEPETNYTCVAQNSVGNAGDSFLSETTHNFYTLTIFILFLVIIILTVAFTYKIRRDRINFEKMLGLHVEKGKTLSPEKLLNDQVDELPYDRCFEIPSEKVTISVPLGEGAFGEVRKATMNDNGYEKTVAVKMIKKNADDQTLKALISEMKIMIHMGNHPNIVNFIGAVTKEISKRKLMLIMEYCCYGNLRDFLINHRDNFKNFIVNGELDLSQGDSGFNVSPTSSGGYVSLPEQGVSNQLICLDTICNGLDVTINTSNLISWAYQVALGMNFLVSKRLLHGDLAARNVLLCEGNVVKICDFGLSKNLRSVLSDAVNDYIYTRNIDTRLPLKWIAIECIRARKFSHSSDVWAYGIFLWEIFSLGQEPYAGIETIDDMYQHLNDGRRPTKPEYATDEIYKIMTKCWIDDPAERPSFESLQNSFADFQAEDIKERFLTHNTPYLKLSSNLHRNDFKTMFPTENQYNNTEV